MCKTLTACQSRLIGVDFLFQESGHFKNFEKYCQIILQSVPQIYIPSHNVRKFLLYYIRSMLSGAVVKTTGECGISFYCAFLSFWQCIFSMVSIYLDFIFSGFLLNSSQNILWKTYNTTVNPLLYFSSVSSAFWFEWMSANVCVCVQMEN